MTTLSPFVPEILADGTDVLREIPQLPRGQESPDGTSARVCKAAELAELAAITAAVTGQLAWAHGLSVPFYRALSAADNDETLRFELVKLAAIAVDWIDKIDKRNGK